MRVCPQCRLIYLHPSFTQCGVHGVALVEQTEDPLVGSQVDRYAILQLVGAGSMGRVYRAHHTGLDRVVALKILHGDYACHASVHTRFAREAQAMAQISHENVVGVTDFGSHGELCFLAMDYLEGRTLDQLIEQRAPLSPLRTATIATQVAAGLAAAHAHGFVHRDLKPANIFVGDSEEQSAKILDFGLVSMVYASNADRITRAGHVIGTPMYMAPEQTTVAQVTPSADLYALGVIIFEMLTGRPPFLQEGRLSMMMAHLQKTPPSLPACGGLEILCMRLLEKRPEDRPKDAETLIQGLKALEEDIALLNEPTVVEFLGEPGARSSTDPELLGLDTFPALGSNAREGESIWVPPPAVGDASNASTQDPPLVHPVEASGDEPYQEPTRIDHDPSASITRPRAVLIEADTARIAELRALLGDRLDLTVVGSAEEVPTRPAGTLYLNTTPPRERGPTTLNDVEKGRPRGFAKFAVVALLLIIAALGGWAAAQRSASKAIALDVAIDATPAKTQVIIAHPGYLTWRHTVHGQQGKTEVDAILIEADDEP